MDYSRISTIARHAAMAARMDTTVGIALGDFYKRRLGAQFVGDEAGAYEMAYAAAHGVARVLRPNQSVYSAALAALR